MSTDASTQAIENSAPQGDDRYERLRATWVREIVRSDSPVDIPRAQPVMVARFDPPHVFGALLSSGESPAAPDCVVSDVADMATPISIDTARMLEEWRAQALAAAKAKIPPPPKKRRPFSRPASAAAPQPLRPEGPAYALPAPLDVMLGLKPAPATPVRFPLAECFHDVCHNVLEQAVDDRPLALVWLGDSHTPNHVTFPVEMAMALTQSCGVPVLVVDADFRHQQLTRRFGLQGSVGLAEALAGKAAVPETIHESSFSASTRHELRRRLRTALSWRNDDAWQALLNELKEQFRFVLLFVASAEQLYVRTMAAASDGAYLLLGLDNSPRQAILDTVSEFGDYGARVQGAVVTDAR